MSPSTDRSMAAAAPLCASTPLAPPAVNGRKLANGYDTHDSPDDIDKVNGNVHVNAVVTQSTTSMDVLSGGESEAGDTLTRQNNNDNVVPMTKTKNGTLETKKRGHDTEYFIAKELLMTERTYKRDLELITVRWSSVVSQLTLSSSDTAALARTCLALGEIVLPSGSLLAKLEKMLSSSNSTDQGEPEYKKISKLLYDHLSSTYDVMMSYVESAGGLVGVVESVRRRAASCARAAAQFDRAAALPLTAALLRPLHRALQHRTHAAALASCNGSSAALAALAAASQLAAAAREHLHHVEHHAALCQLSRDIIDYDKILVADREFIRLGCVYKHSSMGIQQRMLFLFNDILVIASKWGSHEYKTHKVLALHKLQLKEADLPHSFLLIGDEVNILISTSNDHEYISWMDSLQSSIEEAHKHPREIDTELTPRPENGNTTSGSTLSSREMGGALGDNLTQVCWHRAASLSRTDLHLALQTQLSGYLLRKFKKSPGWQKLWVVFAMFKMTFYKSWQDDVPLAALPLHGYSLNKPSESDNIDKDFVFKLEYKTHVYFFRADSQYTYNRWTEVVQTAMVQTNKHKS